MQGMDHGAMGHGATGGMAMGNMPGMSGMMGMGGQMGGMAMDLNDYDWDAYLANDRTLSDPEVVQVERGGRIRLRGLLWQDRIRRGDRGSHQAHHWREKRRETSSP